MRGANGGASSLRLVAAPPGYRLAAAKDELPAVGDSLLVWLWHVVQELFRGRRERCGVCAASRLDVHSWRRCERQQHLCGLCRSWRAEKRRRHGWTEWMDRDRIERMNSLVTAHNG
ncbi:hypothetical protein PLESTF_000098600 [Pleodorina starrii]|nr:hypothetical protein PLESTM_001264600 [Pleodorina starrii]GLC63919.1 hypothetical protein PLESTF_000098600 [Pleodorina starrii]